MAIEINIPSQYGVDAKYWNISLIQNNFIDKVLYVKLFGYHSEEARTQGASPMSVLEFSFRDDQYPKDIVRSELYNLIKSLPEFANAVDII